ncbi:hypothetical protein B0E53_03256 [Micromonospora sp. MH33]|nr:hypothetical protein B0E53_03256 [Micromonospora sp. MH33]
MQVISAVRHEWIFPFTGLTPAQFRRLVRLVAERGGDTIADGRPGRQWALDLPDRVLLVAAYWRTNLTMRQIGPLFGVSHSAAYRVIDTLGPLLALAPVRRRPVDQIAIVDGTLIPTRDHRLAAPSKNYRYSTNLQVAIDASTRLVIAVGDPQPGNRTDTIVYRTSGIDQKLAGRPVMADGGYRQPGGDHPVPQAPRRQPATGLEGGPERPAPHHPSAARTCPGQDEVLEGPTRLPPRRPHIDRRRFRHRQPAQHRPDLVTTNPNTGNAFTQLRDSP